MFEITKRKAKGAQLLYTLILKTSLKLQTLKQQIYVFKFNKLLN